MAAADAACHAWSAETVRAYDALFEHPLPRGRRWEVPVPSADLGVRTLIIDSGGATGTAGAGANAHHPHANAQAHASRQAAREPAGRLAWADGEASPCATAFLARHFPHALVHPALRPALRAAEGRQSVGLEPPVAALRRRFRPCLRLLAAEAQADAQTDPQAAAQSDAAETLPWPLLAELYDKAGGSGRSGEPALEPSAIPASLSEADHWELLLFSALACAQQWHRMK